MKNINEPKPRNKLLITKEVVEDIRPYDEVILFGKKDMFRGGAGDDYDFIFHYLPDINFEDIVETNLLTVPSFTARNERLDIMRIHKISEKFPSIDTYALKGKSLDFYEIDKTKIPQRISLREDYFTVSEDKLVSGSIGEGIQNLREIIEKVKQDVQKTYSGSYR